MYAYLFDKINNTLRKYYYDLYIKENQLIIEKNTFFFKFDYFLYLKFYFIYIFIYYLKRRHRFEYILFLNVQYSVGQLCAINRKHYSIIQENNVEFLENVSHYFFLILFFMEIYFQTHLSYINKFFILNNVFLFKCGNIIKKIYEKRITCIEEKKEFDDPFEFLFLIPHLEDIQHTLFKTRFFNDENMYFFIGIMLILFY